MTIESPKALPTGSVTFLISDVVGSTELWQRFPADMPRAMADHDRILRSVLASHRGHDFDLTGDSFASAFTSAADAVGAAVAIQRALAQNEWVGGVPLQVRIGLNTGQADERDGRYYGAAVNGAARIGSLGGQRHIVMSYVTAALAGPNLPDGVSLHDLGPRRLRSFDESVQLFRADGTDLSNADIASTSAETYGLPTPSTRFIGRRETIAEIGRLLQPGSVVTVTGSGGLGKTRTAIEVARTVAPGFSDGVTWVDLSPLTDAASVATLSATTLGINQQGGLPSVAAVTDALKRQNALVVLDNCEHVISGAGELIEAIEAACPAVAILATSQVRLGIAGEVNVPLEPLDAANDAVALLVDRARGHDSSIDPTRWARTDLTTLCERLDGVPLALEMAAARLRTLDPAEIIDRLDDRFRLLRNRDRTVPDRHRSLEAALGWSYELLDPDEQQLLLRLSVFGGSFDLRAAEQICADDHLDEFDVVDLLASLVDKSLVSVSRADGGLRYHLLETVRAYGRTQLSEADQRTLSDDFVRHYLTESERHGLAMVGDHNGPASAAVAMFTADWDNLREVVRISVDNNDSEACETVFCSVWDYAFQTFRNEVGEWATAASELADPRPTAFGVIAMTAPQSTEQSVELLERGLALTDPSRPTVAASLLHGVLYWLFNARGDQAAALEHAQAGFVNSVAMGSIEVASNKANVASQLAESEPDEAKQLTDEVLDYIESTTNPLRTTLMPSVAMYLAASGNPADGHRLCRDAAIMSEQAGMSWSQTMALAHKSVIATKYGVGDIVQDLWDAVSVGRRRRAWYAVWLALGEAVPWLGESVDAETAALVAGHMRTRGIWFKGTDTVAHSASPTAAPLRRDQLIDRVLDQLAAVSTSPPRARVDP